jgi:hypothetical protein
LSKSKKAANHSGHGTVTAALLQNSQESALLPTENNFQLVNPSPTSQLTATQKAKTK